MNALLVKNWCDSSLSPMAWSRILTRMLPHFNQNGYYFQTLKNPDDSLIFKQETVEVLKETIQDIYQSQLPSAL
ncbi:MAG: hypothetical protein WA958_06125 [Tunicatimonas sp.]